MTRCSWYPCPDRLIIRQYLTRIKMADTKSQKDLKSKENAKESNNANGKNENASKPTSKRKERNGARVEKRRIENSNKKAKSIKNIPTVHGNSDIFSFEEIANNKEASALIYDLVKCFTCDSTLSQDELNTINKTLYEKTVSVFLHILNHCVEKIFNKLLNMGYLNDIVGKKVVKKDAFCQTDISMSPSSEILNGIN